MLGYNEQELVMMKALVEFACSQMQNLECILTLYVYEDVPESAYARIFAYLSC